jgi:phage major head subunit gpT-like protein
VDRRARAQGHGAQGYTITNKLFEASVSVPRVDIEDDSVGVYKPLFGEMGRAAKSFPDELIFGLLGLGRTTLCYDNQYFFDVDHPVYPTWTDRRGANVANFIDEAGGTPWYLLDTSRVIKP